MKLTKRIMHSLPNSSEDAFVLVHKSSAEARGNPHWRIRLWQLIGGPTWSFSFIRNDHPDHLQPGRLIENVFAEYELGPEPVIAEYQARLDDVTAQTDIWIETAERRRTRVFELIGIQYGMVYDIAHVIDDLIREADKMHADGAHASAVNHRLHAHALEQLCPDQDPMIETPE